MYKAINLIKNKATLLEGSIVFILAKKENERENTDSDFIRLK